MNSPIPETRFSLIARLPNAGDVDAWDQFVEIYGPLVFRLARAKGFQDADAQEISQEVLISVSRAVDRWDPNHEKGRFRAWLFRIARNLMVKYLTRRKHQPLGTGDSSVARMLEQCSDRASDDDLIRLEYRREVFRWAAEQVQRKVTDTTWQAFWRVSVEGEKTSDVANELGMSHGAIHIACSRVRCRLRTVVGKLDSGDDSGSFEVGNGDGAS